MTAPARSKAGTAIQARLHELGLTQGRIARELGRSQTWVSQSLLDDSEKTLRRLWVDVPDLFGKLLELLEWDSAAFKTATGVDFTRPYPKPNIFTDEAVLQVPDIRSGTRAVPVYDLVSAGPGCDGGEVIEWVDVPDTWQGDYTGYIIQGDSMAPRIPDGAKVIVRLQYYSPAKNIVVCFTPEEGMLVKFLKEIRPDNVHVLLSFNPNFDPIWAKEVHINGVVVEIRTPVALINGAH